MGHTNNSPGKCFVVMDKDYLQLYTHDGHLVRPNIFIRVQDGITEPNTVIAKFYCNIGGSIEEMSELIKKNQESQ